MVADNHSLSIQQNIKLLEQKLLDFDTVASQLLLSELKQEMSALELVEQIIVPVLIDIGKGWEKGTVALSQVYLSGIIIERFVESIFPAKVTGKDNGVRMAIAVLDDFHFLGKRIVYSFLRAGGFELLDYGHVTERELIERVQQDKIELLLISVLMLPAAIKVRNVKQRLLKAGNKTIIVVGGAPFRLDEKLWRDVGADAVGSSAGDALNIVRNLCGMNK